MTCYRSVQINKNYGGQQVFVLRVQTELITQFPDLGDFPGFSLTISPL
jgi:hypothetical protein